MAETLIDIEMTVILHNNRVSKAPAPLHFMGTNRWTREAIEQYCRERGWAVRVSAEKQAATG